MKKTILLFIILFCANKNIRASHIIGAELTYTFIQTNVYGIQYTIYRDCGGNIIDPTVNLLVSNSCGLSVSGEILSLDTSLLETYSFACPGATTCTVGTYPGVEKWTYRGEITLPGPCDNWVLSCEIASRNRALTTMVVTQSDNIYVYAHLDNSNGLQNSSPVFNDLFIPSTCIGNSLCLLNECLDSEGDSLTYELIAPIIDPLVPVIYNSGFSPTQPFTSSGSILFDHSTGELCGIPGLSEITAIAVLVKEFRNGIEIGAVERDMQLTVASCANNFPQFIGLNNTPFFTTDVCAGQQNCFSIRSTDADLINTTSISLLDNSPGVTLQNSGGTRDTATICWSPVIADTSGNPHCFRLVVTDDNCPVQGINYVEVCMNVIPPICSPLAVNEINNSSLFRVFYSSFTKTIHLKSEKNTKNYSYMISSSLGEKISNSMISENDEKINAENLRPGIYFVYIYNSEKEIIASEKLLVMN